MPGSKLRIDVALVIHEQATSLVDEHGVFSQNDFFLSEKVAQPSFQVLFFNNLKAEEVLLIV